MGIPREEAIYETPACFLMIMLYQEALNNSDDVLSICDKRQMEEYSRKLKGL